VTAAETSVVTEQVHQSRDGLISFDDSAIVIIGDKRANR
jgi:hypothetical protein